MSDTSDAHAALHFARTHAVQRAAVNDRYVKFRLIADQPEGVPAGYKAYRCHIPGYIIHGYLKSVTKAEDGSEVLEPEKERFTSTVDPSKAVESVVYIRNDAVIPSEFLDSHEPGTR